MSNKEYYAGPVNVRKIIREYLAANGFDGLYHENDCGCLRDDLMPCDGSGLKCEPGHRKPTPEDHCQYGEGDWIIGPKADND
jgi:hypothetical protein